MIDSKRDIVGQAEDLPASGGDATPEILLPSSNRQPLGFKSVYDNCEFLNSWQISRFPFSRHDVSGGPGVGVAASVDLYPIGFDLNPPPLVGDPERFNRSGVSFYFCKGLFIFFHVEENEPKEDARVPLYPARHPIERVSRKLASLRQDREPYPHDTVMLGAGQREKPEVLSDRYAPLRGAT